MEITQRQQGDSLELAIKGRMDAYWAAHLTSELDGVIRKGAHHLVLDLSEVDYLSSAGIGVLLNTRKRLAEIHGSLLIVNVSERVRSVLELLNLQFLLNESAPAVATPRKAEEARSIDHERMTLDAYSLDPSASLRLRAIGDPTLFRQCCFEERHCQTLTFPEGSFGIGLGAFGRDFADCKNRFGEFLAAAGAAAYLPTDESSTPDYLASSGSFVPELKALYSLRLEGACSTLLRVQSHEDVAPPSLSEIASACLDAANAEAVGIVLVGESAGLVGAALRRSPALAVAGSSPMNHPEIRDWLSFTADCVNAHDLALVVGVAARRDSEKAVQLASLLRPLATSDGPVGHFHAAAFGYRPLPKGSIPLKETVKGLFETQALRGVLHLLCDDRPITGAGESRFFRGACWVGPISEITTETT